MIKTILNWVCCCGAFEDLIEDSSQREYSEEEVSIITRPLLSDEEDSGGVAGGNALVLNNILGFGRKDVMGDYTMGETLG